MDNILENGQKRKADIPKGKIDYLFGRASGREHNLARTNQNAMQMKRLGIPDTPFGHKLLTEHLKKVPQMHDTVIRVFSSKYGTFEIRESLFAGPSGKFSKFETTWQIYEDGGRRLTTVIPYGGGI
jgi:filamentous hemagglutinin